MKLDVNVTKSFPKLKVLPKSEGKPIQYPKSHEIKSKTFKIKYQKSLPLTAKIILNSFQKNLPL